MLTQAELINHTGPKETPLACSDYQRVVSVCLTLRKKEKEDMTTGLVNPQVNPQVLNCSFNLIFIHSD